VCSQTRWKVDNNNKITDMTTGSDTAGGEPQNPGDGGDNLDQG